MTWWAETGMMEARDIDISNGVNSVSEEDVLARLMGLEEQMNIAQAHIPHANEVLHHEFVQSFRWVSHVNLSLSISEISLENVELSALHG